MPFRPTWNANYLNHGIAGVDVKRMKLYKKHNIHAMSYGYVVTLKILLNLTKKKLKLETQVITVQLLSLQNIKSTDFRAVPGSIHEPGGG